MAIRIVDIMRASLVDRLILVRHLETGYIPKNEKKSMEEEQRLLDYVFGKADPSLSEEGRRMGEEETRPELRLWVEGSFLGVCGPSKRHQETLEILAPGQMYCSDSRLGPPDYNATPVAIREWVKGKMTIPECREAWIDSSDFPKTEQRLIGSMQSFLCNHKETTVVVVSSAEPIGLLWCMAIGAVLPRFVEPEFYVKEGGFVRLERNLKEGTHKYFSVAA